MRLGVAVATAPHQFAALRDAPDGQGGSKILRAASAFEMMGIELGW